MRKLLIYMKAYRKEAFLAPLFKMLEATFELFIPLVIRALIDTGIPERDSAYILRMGLLLAALALTGLVMAITAQYFSAKAAVGFTAKIRQVLFGHLQTLSYTELDQLGTSAMVTRLTSDMNQVQNGVNLVLRLFLRSPFIVFGSMIMAFTIDAEAALVFAAAIVLLSAVVFGIMLVSIPLYKKVQQALDRVTGITRENLTGVRVLRAFRLEENESERFGRANAALNALQMFTGRIAAVMNPVTFIIVNAAIIVLIRLGAWKVEGGVLTQGAIVALVNYMSQILVELIKLANLIINITKSVACGNRIQSVLETGSSMKDGPGVEPSGGRTPSSDTGQGNPAATARVEFRNVSLAYASSPEESVLDVNLKVMPGETVGIIGSTGSGKTSVINMIPRFYDASSGEVLVDGHNVKEYRLEQLREKIGIVPQKAVLFAGTVKSNLLWGRKDASDAELWQALETAQAAEFVRKLPESLDTRVEQGGRNFSGGQRQRLTIARALVSKPEILILDDSASALDFATDAKLRRAIREMDPGTTVFIVSQRAASMLHADRILVLDDGQPVGLGKSDELLESCAVYREIYESQFRREETETDVPQDAGKPDICSGTRSREEG